MDIQDVQDFLYVPVHYLENKAAILHILSIHVK